MVKKVKIGSIIQLKLDEGYIYLQLVAFHQNYGELVKVLQGIYEKPLSDFDDLLNLEERFYVFYPTLTDDLKDRTVTMTSKVYTNSELGYPKMRQATITLPDGSVPSWALYENGEIEKGSARKVEDLSEEEKNYSRVLLVGLPILKKMLVGEAKILDYDKHPLKDK